MQDLPPLFPTSVPHDTDSTVGGCGGFFLINMFDDNDLFACAANQKQAPTKVNLRAAMPLPLTMIHEALEIDETVPSGLRWKTRPRHHFETSRGWNMFNARDAGKPAGARKGSSIYFTVGIDYVRYRTHRIVYALTHGIDPGECVIDHIQPDIPLPNVASNIRLATNSENIRNQKKHTNNTSGVPGVTWDKYRKKWLAQIVVNYKNISLGRFNEFNDAVAARKTAEERYFGEFSYDASRGITHVAEHQ
jgi:hypothetical protein